MRLCLSRKKYPPPAKFWYALVPGGSGAFGMLYVARISSVFGSITRACGAESSDGQTLTMKPREWNVSEPHSAGGMAFDLATGACPIGPAHWYASVIHVSLWMLLRGLRAMNGFCGARVRFSSCGTPGAPAYLGNSGASGSAIGSAAAAAGTASTNMATAHETRRMATTYPLRR